METKKWLHIVSFALVIIGGINWGLFGFFGFDLVDQLIGVYNQDFANVIYTLIGIASIYLLVTHIKECKTCGSLSK